MIVHIALRKNPETYHKKNLFCVDTIFRHNQNMIKSKLQLNRISRILSAIVGETNVSSGESVR